MKHYSLTALTMAAVGFAAITGFTQMQISQDGRPERIFDPRAGMNAEDAHFLREAAMINTFEVQAGQVAEKSTDAFVSEYAKEMVLEHQLALEEVKLIAASKNTPIPENPSPKMSELVMHLENQSGSTLDEAYINSQSECHQSAAALLKEEIETGKDEDVRDFSVKALPIAMFHYRMLLVKETMMGPTKMSHGE